MEIKDIAEYEESDSRLAKYTISQLHEEIKNLKQIIKRAEELNPYSDTLSFDYYRLQELFKVLKDSDKE